MKNIIITGGGLINKGAQAMTYIAISELSFRYPDHKILLMTTEPLDKSKLEIKSDLVSKICWYPIKYAKAQSNPIIKLLCKIRNKKEYEEAVSIYSNCDLMIDISGYALGSNWPDKICSDFLDNIEFAKAFNIPVVLMPQSFGPFEYDESSVIDKRIRELLPYVSVICAREEEGYDYLVNRYMLTNVVLRTDIVLNSSLDLYKESPITKIPEVLDNSVAIIPNDRIVKVYGEDNAISLYSSVIDRLLINKFNVYLVSHSNYDMELCDRLKSNYCNDDKVSVIKQELSCIEFNELVKSFKFCVASRFHSVVHAYKNGVPCIVLGWAVKYRDLAGIFAQDKYVFRVEGVFDKSDILNAIDNMSSNAENESKVITNKLESIQYNNVFDLLNNVKVSK